MSSSATSTRASKRLATSRRIMHAANELTLSHGLDGWTMEDLAEASGVSRRTLFNYFPAKLDAVLGRVPEFPEDALDVFRSRGPSGVLMDDCRVLARRILEAEEFDPRTLRLHREVVAANPRLLQAVHQRFEHLASALVEHVLVREGEAFGVDRARMLVRLMVALFDSCLDSLSPTGGDETRPLPDVFDASLATARELLA